MKKILFVLFPVFLLASEARIAYDFARVNELLSSLQKCSDGDFSGCEARINNVYNVKEVNKYINQACKEQNMAACYMIFNLAKNDYTKYNALRLACQNSFELACTQVIVNFEKNQTKALEILQYQCNKENNLNSCHAAAELLTAYMDNYNASDYAGKACKKGFYNSCILQAELSYKDGDEKKAIELLEQTCKNGYDRACVLAYTYSEMMGDFKKSKEFMQKSCDLNNENSCNKLTNI